ncbi:unnamed protein product [Candidula unifasciata]|uniref:G-protein coupled receptors family 1 profile domain-containing protein n=1 Tax=Candidula unifasciata TaxID=100452 RepID=A0A8S4A011_9EUPU|nr:unnamed protein product [Candidula unifasciata]
MKLLNETVAEVKERYYKICYVYPQITGVTDGDYPVFFWVPLVIGIPANILALLTILRFPRTTGTFYLTLLTIFDLMALVTKATDDAMWTFNFFESISCKLIIMLTNFTRIYANWILVLICFERYITVLFPLKKNFYFTMNRARLVAIIAAVIIFLFCSVYLGIVIADGGCVGNDEVFYKKWVYVTMVLYSYLPAVLLIILVLLIWRGLKKIQKVREYIFCEEEGTNSATLTQQGLQEQAKTERGITMMLLFAAVTFVIMIVPICVVLAVDSTGIAEQSIFGRVYFRLFYTIAGGLVTLTHAVNFFIYFLSTERFRGHFRQLFRCLPYDNKDTYHERTVKTVEEQL